VGAAIPLIQLSLGALLTATALATWGNFRPRPVTGRAVRIIQWVTAVCLLGATLLLLTVDRGSGKPSPILTLMAAVATLPSWRPFKRTPWRTAVRILPAMILTIGSLLVEPDDTVPALCGAMMHAALAACGGLAARIAGDALGTLVRPAARPDRTLAALLILLTLVVGLDALITLGQRGIAWPEPAAARALLASTWLLWIAVRILPDRQPRLRAALSIGASLLLVTAAL